MHRSMVWPLLGFVALALPSAAQVKICFGETITTVTTTGNEVYFTTDKSCPNRCKLSNSLSAAAKDRFYTQLLTVSVTKPTLTFFGLLQPHPVKLRPLVPNLAALF